LNFDPKNSFDKNQTTVNALPIFRRQMTKNARLLSEATCTDNNINRRG